MEKTINMQVMRYLNLFENVSKVRTKHCILYNSAIIFLVPRKNIAKAVGEHGKNVRKISEILNRKVKIIEVPESEGVDKFILDIINPLTFKEIHENGQEIVIKAGPQSKAALIGRQKVRLAEMRNIIKEYFNKDLKVI